MTIRNITMLTGGFVIRLIVFLTLTLAWAYFFEDIREEIPRLERAELKYHQWLSEKNPRPPRIERVTLAEIDDSTYWSSPFSGELPTNRRALAAVARKAADAEAALIALDFQLISTLATPGDDNRRKQDNDDLLEAIREIAGRGIPIVLGYVLVRKGGEDFYQVPNIFKDEDLPSNVFLGHLQLPADRRQIPLRMTAWEWNGSSKRRFDSFALQIVAAFEDIRNITPRTKENRLVKNALEYKDWAYGGLVKVNKVKDGGFPKVSAGDLLRDAVNSKRCQGRIVIIGSTWHKISGGLGDLTESFRSPIGSVPGLYLHGNYVEALLDNRYGPAVPPWLAVFIDLALGVSIYVLYIFTEGWLRLIAMSAVLLILFLGPYVLSVNFGVYFNFVAALSLCFVHLFFESLPVSSLYRWSRGLLRR